MLARVSVKESLGTEVLKVSHCGTGKCEMNMQGRETACCEVPSCWAWATNNLSPYIGSQGEQLAVRQGKQVRFEVIGALKAISEYLDLIWLAIMKIFWAVLLKDWTIIQNSMFSLNSVLQSEYNCLFHFNTTTIYLELPRKRVLWRLGK